MEPPSRSAIIMPAAINTSAERILWLNYRSLDSLIFISIIPEWMWWKIAHAMHTSEHNIIVHMITCASHMPCIHQNIIL